MKNFLYICNFTDHLMWMSNLQNSQENVTKYKSKFHLIVWMLCLGKVICQRITTYLPTCLLLKIFIVFADWPIHCHR